MTSVDIPLGKYETRLILVIVLGQVPVIIKQRTPGTSWVLLLLIFDKSESSRALSEIEPCRDSE